MHDACADILLHRTCSWHGKLNNNSAMHMLQMPSMSHCTRVLVKSSCLHAKGSAFFHSKNAAILLSNAVWPFKYDETYNISINVDTFEHIHHSLRSCIFTLCQGQLTSKDHPPSKHVSFAVLTSHFRCTRQGGTGLQTSTFSRREKHVVSGYTPIHWEKTLMFPLVW